MLYTILLVILILFLLGGLPSISGHSYGYWPSGGAGLLIIIIILVLLFR